MVQRNLKREKVTNGSNGKRSGALTVPLASSRLHFASASPPSYLSSTIMMDQQHADASIVVCQSFLARLSSLGDAMYNRIDYWVVRRRNSAYAVDMVFLSLSNGWTKGLSVLSGSVASYRYWNWTFSGN